MYRCLLYDEAIANSDRIKAEPAPHRKLADHHDLDIRIDSYKQPQVFIDLLNGHGLGSALREPENESEFERNAPVSNLSELLALTTKPDKLRWNLDRLPDQDLVRIQTEIQIRLDQLQIPDYNATDLIPVEISERCDSGKEPFLHIIRMSMFSCGDLEPISNSAALAISDYIQTMLSEAISRLPHPIQFRHIQDLFPRQSAMFIRWWSAKQQIKASGTAGSSSDISDTDEIESSDPIESDEFIDVDTDYRSQSNSSSNSFQIDQYIDLDPNRSNELNSNLYEIEAPAGYPLGCKIGPRIRQNLNRIREQTMSFDEYQYYCRCRQASLVSRANRSKFLSWISLQRNQIASDCFERVIGLLGLIAHDHIGAIVQLGKYLQDHPTPLSFNQVQDSIRSVKLLQHEIGPRARLVPILL